MSSQPVSDPLNLNTDAFGYDLKISVKQSNGTAKDLSTYTSAKRLLIWDEEVPTVAIVDKTMSFDTDGINGVLKYTVLTGDFSSLKTDGSIHYKYCVTLPKAANEERTRPNDVLMEEGGPT